MKYKSKETTADNICAVDLHQAYRLSFLKQDCRLAVVGICFMLIPAVFFLYSDFVLYGFGQKFMTLAGARIFFILVSLVIITLLLKTGKPRHADYYILIYLLSLVALIMFINVSRPPRYIFFVFIDIVVLLSMYFIFPNRLLFQVIPALVLTGFDLVFISYSKIEIPILARNVIFISYALSNIMGMFTSGRLYHYRKEQYSSLVKEKRVSDDLKEAMENIKTLSGLLPICSSCKKIRDDKGYWKQIEEYIEKYSNATLSHSLCDECVETLYGKEKWFRKEDTDKEK